VITKRAARWSKLALLAAGVLALAGVMISPSYAATDTEIYIVQGLPGKNLDVAIDGKSVAVDVKTAAVAGPFKVEPGSRMVTFSEGGTTVLENTFSIKEGSKADVVAHLPASSSGDPLVTVYKYDSRCLRAQLARRGCAAGRPGERRVLRQHCQWRITELVVPSPLQSVHRAEQEDREQVLRPRRLTVQGVISRVYAGVVRTMNVAGVISAPASSETVGTLAARPLATVAGGGTQALTTRKTAGRCGTSARRRPGCPQS
jgi:hypothetical protein